MTLRQALMRLEFGAVLATTVEFEQVTGCRLAGGLKLEALQVAMAAGYAERDAEVQGNVISVYSGGRWVPWPAFRVI
jgi:hypothetical protein